MRNLLLLLCCLAVAAGTSQTVADVNLNVKRSVDGVDQFDRNVYINLHGTHTENELDATNLALMKELGISYGRAVGGTTWQMNRLREDPSRPGFFDPAHMEQLGGGSRNWYGSQSWRHPFESQDWVVSSHISPTFPNGTSTSQGWAPANYGAMGDFFVNFLKMYYAGEGETGEPRPTYLEVMNEPFIHANDLGTTNLEISRFHKVVADSIHAHLPGIQVGGFTAAWPEFERNNFAIWDGSWKTFIEEAGASMDFYSIHLYDVPFVDARPEVQRKGSNIEAILDMIEQYSMLEVGEVKPYVVSEYGSCCGDWDGPYYEERDWLFLKSVSAITMALMERPHLMRKAIPFITGKAQWYFNANGYPYPHSLFIPAAGGGFKTSHLAKYYELWKDVRGTRIDTYASDPDLRIDGFVDGNTANIILTNLDHAATNFELNMFEDLGNTLESVTTLHLHGGTDGVPRLDENSTTTPPTNLQIGAEASMLVRYTFSDEIVADKNHYQTKYYADTYKQSIIANGTSTFNINKVSLADFGEATLRVGFGRAHGRSLRPVVIFNGTQLDVPTDWRGYDQLTREDFFGILEIKVPFDLIEEKNEVQVRFSDSGGFISTVTLDMRSFDYQPIRTSTRQVLNNASLAMFPNPTKDLVTFSWEENVPNFQATIFDLTGRAISSHQISRGTNSMNVGALPAGVYAVVAAFPAGVVTRRLVVE